MLASVAVVARVEHERDLGRRVEAAARLEKLRGPQDQKGRGDVSELERADGEHQRPQSPPQDRANSHAYRLALAALETWEAANRVDDREDREKAGDDREKDCGAHADEGHEGEGEQRPANRPEVVHRPLETVGAPIDLARHRVGKKRVSRRNPQPARGPGAGAGATLDHEDFACGRATPVFFGSAVSNFGVELLLDALLRLAPPPHPRLSADGAPRPLDAPFSGLVFKVQANMDPRHRDRVAFLRVCSGRFERGMRAVNARTGRPFTLTHAHEIFGDERVILDQAFPGDIVGIINAADLRVGDTLYLDEPVEYPPIPTLAPEHFVTVRNRDTGRHKQFHRGLAQLAEEGVVHLLRRHPSADPTPVLAAVGPLQFEVAVDRLEREFGVTVTLDPTNWVLARRTDATGAQLLRASRHADVLYRSDGTQLALFTSDWTLDRFQREHPDVTLERMLTT